VRPGHPFPPQVKQASSASAGSLLSPIAILLGLLSYYLAIFLRYRPYDIDNPWFLSFSYDACVEHISSDQFMNVRFPFGMDGTQFFGRLAAYLQCGLLNHTGWQQWPGVGLSASLVVLALGFWWLKLRKLGFSQRFVLCFLVAVGFSEPLVSTANKFRYEFLSFTLISLGLLLVAYRRPLLGIFVAGLAIEVQPTALAGLIPVLVLAFDLEKPTGKLAARLAAGLALAAVVYLALHPNIFHLRSYLAQSRTSTPAFDGGFFISYFTKRARHLPELLSFFIAGIFYWRQRHAMTSHYLGISSLALTLFSAAFPHGNPAYMVFLYPFLVAMTLCAFRADRHPWLIAVLALLFALPQQIYVAYLTRTGGLRTEDVARVSQAIQDAAHQLKLNDDTLRIYGDYRLWFAHPHFYSAAAEYTLPFVQDADLYLCYDRPPQPIAFEPPTMLYCPTLSAKIPLRLVGTVLVRNDQVFLFTKQ